MLSEDPDTAVLDAAKEMPDQPMGAAPPKPLLWAVASCCRPVPAVAKGDKDDPCASNERLCSEAVSGVSAAGAWPVGAVADSSAKVVQLLSCAKRDPAARVAKEEPACRAGLAGGGEPRATNDGSDPCGSHESAEAGPSDDNGPDPSMLKDEPESPSPAGSAEGVGPRAARDGAATSG